jgi:hypothetical protein
LPPIRTSPSKGSVRMGNLPPSRKSRWRRLSTVAILERRRRFASSSHEPSRCDGGLSRAQRTNRESSEIQREPSLARQTRFRVSWLRFNLMPE